jgi:hypothetical protein
MDDGDDILDLTQPPASRWAAVGWGLGGFLVGAVFWHLIGFWDFVGAVLYKRQQETSRIELLFQQLSTDRAAFDEVRAAEAAAHEAAQNCTTLVLDRLTGRTQQTPCMVVIRRVPADLEAGATRPPLQTAARLDRQ